METTKIKKMMKIVENALTAASFSEVGQNAHSLLRESRRVLLGLKAGQIDPRTLKYALNSAKRIDANIDILYVTGRGGGNKSANDPLLAPFESELAAAKIPYRVIYRSGCLKEHIIEYSNSEKEILFAVIESPATLDDDCTKHDKVLAELWRNLQCPLVVVMDGARA